MGYKYKPNKGAKKRFSITGTGKVKRRSQFNSHLRSGRSGNMQRRLGRPQILAEGHARNIRYYLGVSGTRPGRIAHARKVAATAEAKAAE